MLESRQISDVECAFAPLRLYRSEFGLLQFSHRAWTDAQRCDSLRTVFGSFSYCPFTVHLVPKIGYIRWNWLKQAKRLTVRQDS